MRNGFVAVGTHRPPRGRRWRRIVLALGIAATIATGGTAANAGLLVFLKPAPEPTPSATETTNTTAPDTAEDTGYTRMRVTIESQSAWANLRLDGAAIKARKVVSTSGSSITSLGPAIATSGSGTAVVDFVFKIAPDAVTSMRTCRSSAGPVTFTLTRMTDAPTTVAQIANGGLPRPPQDGRCENYRRDSVARSDLIGPIRWPPRKDARRLVLASFFPWYDANTLQRTYGDQPVGPANTSDPAQVAEAMTLATDSGIDGFVVHYEGSPFHKARIDLAVTEASKREGFFTALAVDLAILAQRHNGLPPEVLDAALAEVAKQSAYPSQLRVENNPVVFVYAARKTTLSNWQAALDRLQEATGITPYVIADAPWWQSPGLYRFGNRDPDRTSLDQTAWANLYNNQLLPSLSDVTGPLWVAPVSPGYDESRLGRPTSLVIPRNGGLRFDDEWGAMLTSLPDWVLVTSWNEYFEQTHVMPGHTTGMRALDQLKTWTAHFKATG